jgi:hypothetical protein
MVIPRELKKYRHFRVLQIKITKEDYIKTIAKAKFTVRLPVFSAIK